MIEINLIPPHLRKKKKSSLIPGGFNIPLEVVVGAGGGLIILLVLIHVFLLFTNISKVIHHKDLKRQWSEILPSKEKVDVVINELRRLQKKHKAIEDLTQTEVVLWAQKLNILSNSLPRGVWFKKIATNEDILFMQGSAISRKKQEMINVHTLTSNLKKQDQFLKGLSDIELGSIQRRKIKKIEIADFLITAKIK